MNHIYKVVWSRARNCYMAVSEIAKGHGKSSGKEKSGKMILASLAVAALACGTTAYANDTPASGTETDTLVNQIVRNYDHPDRDLIINWDERSNTLLKDGSAIRNGTVNARNITIGAKFNGNQWTDKGIISEGTTHVTAGENINVTTHDDAVYTQSSGTITIDGFKNLNVTSTGSGYGLVDNGNGITVNGGEDSTVDISATLRPAIGNTLKSVTGNSEYAIGTGISIEAGKKITLSSPMAAVFSGINKNYNFQTTLNAPEIELNGSIYVGGGSVSIDDNQPGNVIIHASQDDSLTEGYSINSYVVMPNSSDTEPNSTVISINKNQGGRVQLDGGISNTGFSTVMINMTGNNSFITTVGEKDKELKNAVYTQSDAVTTLNMSGDDSYIHGDLDAETGGKITLNASGKGFKMDRSYSKSDYPNLLTAYSEDSQINEGS